MGKSFEIKSPDSGRIYDVQWLISEGAYGKVFKAKESGTWVALKCLQPWVAENEIRREKDILDTLQKSPKKDFFILLKEYFFCGVEYIQIFEYMEMDMRTYLQEYAIFPTKHARKLLHQLLQALIQLKACSIIHADLKPENVMINSNMDLKVIDFGLSHYTAESEDHTQIVTLQYRAPEIILGAGHNEAIDMWSFGCIAAEMLVNRTLYPGKSEFEMLDMLKQTHGDFPQGLVQSGELRDEYFDRQGHKFILMSPEKYGCQVEKVGTTLMTMALGKKKAKFSAKGMVRRMELARVIKQCLEMDPSIRMQPTDALESKFFATEQWEYSDLISIQCPIRNGIVPCTPNTPPSDIQSTHAVSRSRSPVIW